MISELAGATDADGAQLDPVDLQIFGDHQGIDCGHALVRVGQDCCYIVYSRIAEHKLPYCLIHYVSNRRLFADQHAAIRRHLMCHTRSRCVIVEARLLGELRLPLAFRVSANEKLYRGADVVPHEIDTLYSEMVLFKHSVLPGLRQRLRTAVKRCIPPGVRRYVGIRSDSVRHAAQ